MPGAFAALADQPNASTSLQSAHWRYGGSNYFLAVILASPHCKLVVRRFFNYLAKPLNLNRFRYKLTPNRDSSRAYKFTKGKKKNGSNDDVWDIENSPADRWGFGNIDGYRRMLLRKSNQRGTAPNRCQTRPSRNQFLLDATRRLSNNRWLSTRR